MTPATNDEREDIAGVILAGGASRRMGGKEKALLPLGGRPLLCHVIDRLRPQVGRLVLNANGDPSRLAAFGLPVVPDAGGDLAGPLAGILAGMTWAAGFAGTRWIATTPADTPFVPDDLVVLLAAALHDDTTIAMARSRAQVHPVIGLFPVTLRGDLQAWLRSSKDRAARAWVGRHRIVTVDFPDAPSAVDPFFNVNTPEDLSHAAAMLAQLRW